MIPRRTALPALPAFRVVAALLIGLLAAGCSGALPFGSAIPGETPAVDRIHAQANDALHRWADAVAKSGGATITFVGDQTSQVGDWEKAVGDNDKRALMAGLLSASPPLSDAIPSRGTVKWVDGSSVDVDVLSASAALSALVAGGAGDCSDCAPLVVTDAKLATSLVETSTGPAEAPTWVFTIKGTAVHVTRVAVDPSVTVVPPPFNADRPPEGVSIDAAFGKADSRKLTVTFVGGCGADYTEDAVESDLAVVVIVEEVPDSRSSGACDLVGHSMTATLMLADPLGKRAVLEVRQGLPVPVNAP